MKKSLKKKTSSEYEEQSGKFFGGIKVVFRRYKWSFATEGFYLSIFYKKKSGRLRMFSDSKRHFMGFFAHNFLFKLSYIILCKDLKIKGKSD